MLQWFSKLLSSIQSNHLKESQRVTILKIMMAFMDLIRGDPEVIISTSQVVEKGIDATIKSNGDLLASL